MGLGVRVIRTRWNLLEAISTSGKLSVPSLSLGPSPLHSSQQLFQLFSSLLRPLNPPPSFTVDDFTSGSTKRTKPLVYTDGLRVACESGRAIWEDLGFSRCSATSTVARRQWTSPPSASVSPPVEWVVARFQSMHGTCMSTRSHRRY